MIKLFKVEFTKAIKNKFFLLSILIGIILCFYSAINVILSYYDDLNSLKTIAEQSNYIVNPMCPAYSLYNKWIGQEWISMTSSLFFLLLPLTAAIPYSWSYCVEKKSGYINNIYTRTNNCLYITIKFLVTFLTGVITSCIPLLFNLMLVSSFLPAIKPDVYYDIYYNMPISNIFSEFFYNSPLLYILLKIALINCFSGAFAVLAQAIGTIIKNKFIVILFPFVVVLIFNYISNVFSPNIELSPIQFLYGGGDALSRYWIIPLELTILIIGSFFIMKTKGAKKDVL